MRVFTSVIVGLLSLTGLSFPASATPVYITYNGVLTSGSASGQISGIAGSLAGDTVSILLAYDTTALGSIYTSGPTSSSIVSYGTPGVAGSGGANVSVAVSFISSDGQLLQQIGVGNIDGVATDVVTAGNMQQTLTNLVNQNGTILGNLFSGSVTNSLIAGDLTKSLLLNTGPLNAFFDIRTPDFEVTGSMDSGYVTVSSPAMATPLPDTLPLFATGLGLLGMFGWWRRRRTQTDQPLM